MNSDDKNGTKYLITGIKELLQLIELIRTGCASCKPSMCKYYIDKLQIIGHGVEIRFRCPESHQSIWRSSRQFPDGSLECNRDSIAASVLSGIEFKQFKEYHQVMRLAHPKKDSYKATNDKFMAGVVRKKYQEELKSRIAAANERGKPTILKIDGNFSRSQRPLRSTKSGNTKGGPAPHGTVTILDSTDPDCAVVIHQEHVHNRDLDNPTQSKESLGLRKAATYISDKLNEISMVVTDGGKSAGSTFRTYIQPKHPKAILTICAWHSVKVEIKKWTKVIGETERHKDEQNEDEEGEKKRSRKKRLKHPTLQPITAKKMKTHLQYSLRSSVPYNLRKYLGFSRSNPETRFDLLPPEVLEIILKYYEDCYGVNKGLETILGMQRDRITGALKHWTDHYEILESDAKVLQHYLNEASNRLKMYSHNQFTSENESFHRVCNIYYSKIRSYSDQTYNDRRILAAFHWNHIQESKKENKKAIQHIGWKRKLIEDLHSFLLGVPLNIMEPQKQPIQKG